MVVNLSNKSATVELADEALESRDVVFGEALIGGSSINLDPNGFVIVAHDE